MYNNGKIKNTNVIEMALILVVDSKDIKIQHKYTNFFSNLSNIYVWRSLRSEHRFGRWCLSVLVLQLICTQYTQRKI